MNELNPQIFRRNPVNFFKAAWPDIYLWDRLEEICIQIVNNRRVVIPSGHGIGKTWLLARIALWFLFSFYPSKVITSAPTWSQVELLLWSEIKNAYNSSQFRLGGRILETQLKIEDDWFAIGLSTRGKAKEREFGTPKFQGFHSENLLVLLDEAPGIEPEIWTSVETLITGINNKIVAIGNPTSPSGKFYEACMSPLWHKLEISSFNHPNITSGKIIVPGAVTAEWIEERRKEWGEDSPLWQAKVLGQFPDEGDDTLIPLSWAEQCIGLDLGTEGEKRLGVDVARFGSDMTVFCTLHGSTVLPLEAVNKKDTNFTIGRVRVLNDQQGFSQIGIDDTGVGGGVTDGLKELKTNIAPVNFGEAAIESERFENKKAELFWVLRELIRDKQLSLPDDKELINQLCSIKYSYTRKGKIKIESKDELKKRGLKSPDKADALAIALAKQIKKTI
jgi:hypothetical protein